jgi:DNA topoisomerase-1
MTALERLSRTGIRRLGSPKKGFRYVYASGRTVGEAESSRIAALKLPPAWKEVRISPFASAKLQAVGKDGAGRWQYAYHPRFVRKREQEKFDRLVRFARDLPELRKRVRADLSKPGLGRERVMACILRILSRCFMRPGSEVYARDNGHYGIATIRAKHVHVRGETVVFDYPGKSGKQQHREIRDRQVAQVVRKLLQVRGRDVFKFQTEEGETVDVRRRHINDYIREITGKSYSAKDFRTWAGTLICACALARSLQANPDGKRTRKEVTAAIRETAEHLGNTPAICRSSYINPSVLNHFQNGQVVRQYVDKVDELIDAKERLHACERSLLELLDFKLNKRSRPAAPRAPQSRKKAA